MTQMLLEYDESVDAAYLRVSDADWHHQQRLDDAGRSTMRQTVR